MTTIIGISGSVRNGYTLKIGNRGFEPSVVEIGFTGVTGAVVQRGLHKVAVYRDEAGVAHEMSALCTHLQCVIRWNSEERSWDCPCHGSRFAPTGEVLTGPAIYPLKRLDAPKD